MPGGLCLSPGSSNQTAVLSAGAADLPRIKTLQEMLDAEAKWEFPGVSFYYFFLTDVWIVLPFRSIRF